jgi:hypothetical protein
MYAAPVNHSRGPGVVSIVFLVIRMIPLLMSLLDCSAVRDKVAFLRARVAQLARHGPRRASPLAPPR